MVRYYVYPLGMPTYNCITVEVTKQHFDELIASLMDAKLHVSTDIEAFNGNYIEKWFVDYQENGEWSGYKSFGFTLAPLGEIDTLPEQ